MDWSFGNLLWIVIGGAILGILARMVMPGKQRIPFWATIAAGIIGMLVGDALAAAIGVKDTFGIDWVRHALQVLVAIVAVVVVGFVRGRRVTR